MKPILKFGRLAVLLAAVQLFAVPCAIARAALWDSVWLMDRQVAVQIFDCNGLLCGRILALASLFPLRARRNKSTLWDSSEDTAMSRLFGELRQVGIVVRDIEAAMKHWVEVCGVGPWFYTDKLSVTEFSYRGQRHDDIHVSIALANSGDVQLELIQQRCQTPSMYRDFLAAGREGMQHWSSWPVDYDDRLKRALSSGHVVGQQGDSARGRFVYLWNEGHPGTVIEMAHMTEGRQRIFDGVRTAAIGWDGSEPIRRAWPT